MENDDERRKYNRKDPKEERFKSEVEQRYVAENLNQVKVFVPLLRLLTGVTRG